MQDIQEFSVIELDKILSTYFRLSPDRYAREHFQNHLKNSSDGFNPQAVRNWLQARFQDDAVMIQENKDLNNIPPGFDWADFEPNSIASILSGFGRELDDINEFIPTSQNSLPSSDISHTNPLFTQPQ